MTELIKISTWNVNSVRIRVQQIKDWLQRNNIDIILMQEIKCQTEDFPYAEFEDIGYNCYVLGQKSYNGVAILSKYRADNIEYSFEGNPSAQDARFISASMNLPIGYVRAVSLYVPNGGSLESDKFSEKLLFLSELKNSLKQREYGQKTIIGGDFNVAPSDLDVYSQKEMEGQLLFSTEEKARIRSLKNIGLIDPIEFIEPEERFTWWDYRAGNFQNNKGARIDYFLTTSNLSSHFANISVDKNERKSYKPSDHAPVTLQLYSSKESRRSQER